MIRKLFSLLLLLLAGLTAYGQTFTETDLQLIGLLRNKEYFELDRRLQSATPDTNSPVFSFCKAIAAHAFNEPARSNSEAMQFCSSRQVCYPIHCLQSCIV